MGAPHRINVLHTGGYVCIKGCPNGHTLLSEVTMQIFPMLPQYIYGGGIYLADMLGLVIIVGCNLSYD
jgi:hypothetical protein